MPEHFTETYLHGTSPLAAIGIAIDGFRVSPHRLRFHGRGALGDGIYVTRSLFQARDFMRDFEGIGRGAILHVVLSPGTRILRLDGNYDQRVIDSLRREFGAEVLRLDFHKAIPANKHLKPRELIALLNYLDRRCESWFPKGWPGIAGIRAQLRRLGFAGFGNIDSDIGVALFDPSRLRVVRAVRFADADTLVSAEPRWLYAHAVEQLRELLEDDRELRAEPDQDELWSPEEQVSTRIELERASRQLEVYAQRHSLREQPLKVAL